jgi:hypothetical protein
MQKHVLVMLAECVPGTEDDFNEWYTNTHLAEVLRIDGFVAAQRFEVAELDPAQEGAKRYLTIYEVEGDVQSAAERLRGDAPNRAEAVGLDRTQSRAVYYTALTERVTPDTLAARPS